MDEGLNDFGRKVIRKLLKQNGEKRIHIDIKHMNCRSRMDYYDLLKSEYNNEFTNEDEKVPVFVSHGALNGYKKINCDIPDDGDNGDFYGGNVNFCDDEIILIAETHGVFGLQLDDRLLSSRRLKKEAGKGRREERLNKVAGIIWNHIRHAAEILDEKGLDAWGTVALGTDYDGIVDPPNGYWTSADMPLLYCNLFGYVRDYLKPGHHKLHMASNYQRTEDEIMQNLFSENARRFMEKFYI
jgi:microsomal dipeptidase-like Zn-dependent dipeptidase